MFVYDFLIDETDDILYNSYKTILTYAKALKNDGYVMFAKPDKIVMFEQDQILNLQIDEKIIQVKFHRYGEGSNSIVFIDNNMTIVKTANLSKI